MRDFQFWELFKYQKVSLQVPPPLSRISPKTRRSTFREIFWNSVSPYKMAIFINYCFWISKKQGGTFKWGICSDTFWYQMSKFLKYQFLVCNKLKKWKTFLMAFVRVFLAWTNTFHISKCIFWQMKKLVSVSTRCGILAKRNKLLLNRFPILFNSIKEKANKYGINIWSNHFCDLTKLRNP